MKRLLLDTNIYGYLVVDDARLAILKNVITRGALIYGFAIVRNELRKTARNVSAGNLRMDMLRLYDSVVKKTYELERTTRDLAESYFEAYRNIGGTTSKDTLFNDFLIVACASLNNIDIVVSSDRKTLGGELAIKSYTITNTLRRMRVPNIWTYEDFKDEFKK